MESQFLPITCGIGILALLAWGVTLWLKKRTLYLPAKTDTSQPVNQEVERERVKKIRAQQRAKIWIWFVVISFFACLMVAMAPSFKKISGALSATNTPTITPTRTITNTPTITKTPRDTKTPSPTSETLTPGTGTARSASNATSTVTPYVVYQQIRQTVVVRETVIVKVNVPVVRTVIVEQTVIVTPTFTQPVTVTDTETPTQTPTETPTETPSPTPTETPTEIPTEITP